MNEELLRPVIIAMALYLILNVITPKKPTGIRVVDDVFMTIHALKGSTVSVLIIIGFITIATELINKEIMK